MFVYRRQRSDSDSRGLWLLGVRALVGVVVLATDWGVLRNPVVLDAPHALYIIFGGLVFLTYTLSRRYRFRRVFYCCLSVQFIAELIIEGGIVASSGGLSSPFFALYLLTVVSAALSYRLVGTLLIATAAAIAYFAVVHPSAGSAGGLFGPRLWQAWAEGTDELFFTIFLRICIFYILAFISGYLAQRLEHKNQALASTSQALQAARVETGDILKHLHSGLLTLDAHGAVTYFNQAAEDILKISARAVKGRSIKEAFGKRYPELAECLLGVCHSRRGSVRGEIEVETEPGRRVPLGISTSIMGSEDNQRGVIAVFQDITDAKLMEERLRLKDRLAAIGELAAGIAHEIRNPLAAISGSVEVLKSELDAHDENRKLLELIVKESSRLNDIITEFLFYTRVRPTVLGRVRLGSVVQDVFEIVRRRPGFDSRVDLQAHLADAEVLVSADEDHLKQLLLNLVINALEAIGNQPGRIAILSRDVSDEELPEPPAGRDTPDLPPGARRKSRLCLTVSDDGPGIPQDIQEKIWQPFFSTKSSGTGLGLAIVRRLVENLSGQIEVESTLGEGTKVHFYLERHPAKAPVCLTPESAVR